VQTADEEKQSVQRDEFHMQIINIYTYNHFQVRRNWN